MIPEEIKLSLFKGKINLIEKRLETASEEIKPVLGVNMKDLVLNREEIPYILIVLISYFQINNQIMKTEGLFRVSGSVSEEEEMENALRKKKIIIIYTLLKILILLLELLKSFLDYFLNHYFLMIVMI